MDGLIYNMEKVLHSIFLNEIDSSMLSSIFILFYFYFSFLCCFILNVHNYICSYQSAAKLHIINC